MNSTIKKLITPTGLEYIWYLIVSIILLIFTHFQKIIGYFTQDERATQSVSDIIQTEVDQFLDLLSSYTFSATTVTFGFWILVGSLIYIFAMFLIDFFSEGSYFFHEETDFVHTQSYHQGTAYREFIMRSVLHFAFFVVFALYLLLFVQFLWPVWGHLFENFMDNITSVTSWLKLIISIIGFMISIHIASVLSRMLFLRTRVFRSYK